MSEKISKYSYSNRDIFMAGIVSQIAICLSIFSLALFYLYNYKPVHHGAPLLKGSQLLIAIAWCCAGYFVAVCLVYSWRNFLRKLAPVWITIPFAGAVISSVSAAIFSYLSTLEKIKNYKEPEISFGLDPRPVLPTFEELIWQILIPAVVLFSITCLVSFLFPHIYKLIPKKEKEEILHIAN